MGTFRFSWIAAGVLSVAGVVELAGWTVAQTPPAGRPLTPQASTRPTPAAAPATAAATAGVPAAKQRPVNYANGAKVEVKWGGSWREATVKNKGNGWTLINYSPGSFHEWVEPWRIRELGSTEDDLPFISGHEQLFRPQPPPTNKPPPAPAKDNARRSRGPDKADAGAVAVAADATSKPPAGGDPNAEPTDAKKPATLPALPVNPTITAGVRRVSGGGDTWSATVDPTEQPKAILGASVALTGGSGGRYDKVAGMLLATPATPTAFVMHLNTDWHVPPESRIERVDLATGKSLGSVLLPVPVEAHDVSRDGKRLLGAFAWRDDRANHLRRLDVFDVSGSQPQHVASFKPVIDPSLNDAWQEIQWARFASAAGGTQHVLVAVHHSLTCWDFMNGKAVWTAETSPVTPAVSPGGKYVAFGVGADVVIAEATTGKVVGTLPTGMRHLHGGLSFRRDGRLLALAGGDTVRIWDLSNGKPLFHAIADVEANRVDFLSDGFLLLNGAILFDLKKQVPVWHYTGPAFSSAFVGRLWYVVAQRAAGKSDSLLANAQLPDAATLGEIAKLGDELYAVKPGTKVSLDVGGLPGEIQEKAKAGIEKNLAAAGMVLEEGAAIRIIARIEPGKTTEMSYRSFGAGFRDEPTKMSVTSQVSKLSIVGPDGQTIWERQAGNAPPMSLSLKEGQTIDQAVAEQMKPTAWLFEQTNLPPRISKVKGGTFGTTELTTSGPRNATPRKPAL